MSLCLAHTTRTYPKLPYQVIKDDILGKNYNLSLVFVGAKRAKALNQTTRQKSYVPNVLSFPLSNEAGEIYLTPAVAKRETKRFGHTYRQHVCYLFIHGLLHLKGFDHGPKMEKLEDRYLKKYSD